MHLELQEYFRMQGFSAAPKAKNSAHSAPDARLPRNAIDPRLSA
jgi:hypothetical protein